MQYHLTDGRGKRASLDHFMNKVRDRRCVVPLGHSDLSDRMKIPL